MMIINKIIPNKILRIYYIGRTSKTFGVNKVQEQLWCITLYPKKKKSVLPHT